jgi:hypothetical protein
MGCKTGEAVRNAVEGLLYFIEDYATFLENNSVVEIESDVSESEFERRRRDGIRVGGGRNPDTENTAGECETTKESGVSEGEKHSEPPSEEGST